MNTGTDYWGMFGGAEKAATILSSELAFRVRLGEIFGETKVDTWLYTPNPSLNNKKPVDMIFDQDLAPLYEMLYKISSGEPL
jgi:hypothetical protein